MIFSVNTCKEHNIYCNVADESGRCKAARGECTIHKVEPVHPVPSEPVEDPVNSPSHYMHGGVETIDIIRSMLTPEEFRGYLKGNILKYRERAMFKGKTDEDYAKAKKYYDWLMEEGNNE